MALVWKWNGGVEQLELGLPAVFHTLRTLAPPKDTFFLKSTFPLGREKKYRTYVVQRPRVFVVPRGMYVRTVHLSVQHSSQRTDGGKTPKTQATQEVCTII